MAKMGIFKPVLIIGSITSNQIMPKRKSSRNITQKKRLKKVLKVTKKKKHR